MPKRDVILTIFANSSQAPYSKWAAKYFSTDNLPLILTCPGSGGQGFRASIQSWAKTGDVFAAAVKQLSKEKDIEIGRRALITFSVGWAGGEELLKIEAERNRLDYYILLDGCHARDLTPWIAFAERAAKCEASMILAHSSIVPPNFPSSTKTNTEIFHQARSKIERIDSEPWTVMEPPEYVLRPEMPLNDWQVSLGASGGMSAETKVWAADPLKSCENLGNLTRLHYKGDGRCDHCYIAWYVAERCFRWLAEDWSN